ncbi:MAG TPA: mechanosensitive ion channel family protein [Acidobacteriaceae bacterium]|nr:mechanosensitive ion channel family protein [Acidobacteriaceae bacterium]
MFLIAGARQFFTGVWDKYDLDLQDFLHDKLERLVGVALLCWLLVWLLGVISRHILRLAERQSGTTGHYAQVRTLTSVIRATGLGVIIVLATLQVLSVFGFNLGPLLTSAGVAGVAIGLAAQNIVKDCFNGFLILIEDQYNVGDVVTVAGVSGTVETMTLRRTQVRGADGTLYIIPNSQITVVANLLRGYSLATISVSVDFSANPDAVMQVLRDAAMSVRNDPQYRDVYLADPILLGVDAIKGSQVIYPVQLKTKANQQWAAQRETQRRIRLALEEHGMLPGDPMRVYARDGDPRSAIGVQSAGAAKGHEHVAEKTDPTAAKPTEGNPLTGE